MIAFMFPGQGAQFSGMGAELFQQYPREVTSANEVLGRRIEDICSADEATLRLTENTQPALFVVNYLSALRVSRLGLRPDATAGHSLGELNALVAAGALRFEDALQVAMQRGRAMAAAADEESSRGTMVAATSMQGDTGVRRLLDDHFPDWDVATLNSPTQIGLAGPRDEAQALCDRINGDGLGRAIVLNVGGAFHSRYMEGAARTYEAWLRSSGLDFRRPAVPVYSNVTAAPYPGDRESTIELLVKQLTSPVLWRDTVLKMAASGPALFQEFGPRHVVSPLIRETLGADQNPAVQS